MKKVNAQEIIDATDAIARNLYREGSHPEDRLAYQVGALSVKIRELVRIVNEQDDLIEDLINDVKKLQKELA